MLAVASMAWSVLAGNIFFWQRQGSWGEWSDPNNWSLDSSTMSNPDSLVPGDAADDKVNYQGYTYSGDFGTLGYFDLKGGDYTIHSLTADGKAISPNWKSYKLHITNGTLRISSQTAQSGYIAFGFELYKGATLYFNEATTSKALYTDRGMFSYWNVRDGARMEVRGLDLQFSAVDSTISAGGTLLFDPDLASIHNSQRTGHPVLIKNYGTLIAPRGLRWNGTDIYTTSGNQKIWRVYQKAGSTTYLGGDFSKTTEESPNSDGHQCEFKFVMEGGTLVTSNQVAFANRTSRYGTETYAAMTGSATVRTETGSVLDMGVFTYSAGVELTKEGPGTLMLRTLPPNLDAKAGVVQFCEPLTSGVSYVSFDAGVKVVLGSTGNEFTVGNYSDLDFALASSGFSGTSEDLLTSNDPDFLAYVLARILSTVPSYKEAVIEGNTIKLRYNSSATLYWRGAPNSWANWGDASNWSMEIGSSFNPGELVPGASGVRNPIYPLTVAARVSDYDTLYGKFNLQGGSYSISGYSVPSGVSGGLTWICPRFYITNGTLTVENTYIPASATLGYYVWSDATLNYTALGEAALSANTVGRSGLYEKWIVRPGGCFNVTGGLYVWELDVIVDAGGKLSWSPGRFVIHKSMDSSRPFRITNNGDMVLTNGLQWVAGEPTGDNKKLVFSQNGGTVLFGGDFVKSGEEGASSGHGSEMSFEFSGGMLIATNQVAFKNVTVRYGQETFASVADNASVAVRVLGAESKLDMRLFTYGSGASVAKDGEGLLVVSSLPSSLAVNAGGVEFGSAVADLSAVTLADGVRVVFGAPGNTFAPPANYDELGFALDADAFDIGSVVISSSDAGFLAYVKGQIESNGTLPSETKLAIEDGALKVVADGGDVFSGEGEFDIGTTGCWSGGSVPVGKPVIIAGATTVASMSAGAPVFSSITLVDGATLKVANGVDLPPMNLSYPSTLQVENGASVVLTNGISSTGGAQGLPVISVATNATLTVAAGTVFKNVDIRLYGTVTTDEAGILTFGGASAGELVYFAMTSIGGTVRSLGYAGTGISNAYRRFAVAEGDGAVVVQGSILFRDSHFSVINPTNGGQGYCGTLIGYGNSTAYPFELVFDNTSATFARSVYISGATTFRITNGSVLKVAYSHPGVATEMFVEDTSKISVEGVGSELLLENASPYRNQFQPSAAGTESLVIKDGGLVAAHNTKGNGKAVVRVEDGVMAVPNLPFLPWDKNPCPQDEDVRNWMSDLFTGFREVSVQSGKTLYIASADLLNTGSGSIAPVHWDRDVKIANVPLTGGGDVVLTNTTPGYALAVTVVNGSNTCTGRIYADPKAEDPTTVRFADGANWAGTVVGGPGLALTNLTDAAAPASVSFAGLELAGRMPLRVWKDGSSDVINLGSAITGSGKIVPVFMDGKPESDVTYTLGRYPASAGVPSASYAGRGCTFSVEPIPESDEVLLKMKWSRYGMFMTIK